MEEIISEKVNEKMCSGVWCRSYNGSKAYEISEFTELMQKHFESCKINFLVGAGYSCTKLNALGSLENLIEKNNVENTETPFTRAAIEALILYVFFQQSIYPHLQDIESKKSFEESNNFIQSLYKMLGKRNDKNLLSRANIFTSNYDMYLELSLEEIGVNYNDGFAGRMTPEFSCHNYNKIVKQVVQHTERESHIPMINLLKFHGSLSWDMLGDSIVYRISLGDYLRQIEDTGIIFEHESFCYKRAQDDKEKELNSAIESISLIYNDDDFKEIELEEFLKAYRGLQIINPTKKKFEDTLFNNVYYDLLRMYSNELEKSTSILISFGFSFRDEHIRDITKRALSNASLTLYIFAFRKSHVENYEEIFKNYNNVFYVYLDEGEIDLAKFTQLLFGGEYE